MGELSLPFPRTILYDAHVFSSYRGKRVGKRICEEATRYAQTHKYRKLVVIVGEKNIASRKIFERENICIEDLQLHEGTALTGFIRRVERGRNLKL